MPGLISPAIAPADNQANQHDDDDNTGDRIQNGPAFPFQPVANAIHDPHRSVAELIVFQFACTLFFVFSHLFDSRSFFASPYSELRSSGCMMSETLTLMVATKACQASDLATPRGWTVGVLPLFAIKGHRRIHMEVY